MPEINPDTVAQVILLAREMRDPGTSSASVEAQLRQFIARLTEEEKLELVAIMWIGRDSFTSDEWDEALDTARSEQTNPTEDYLVGTDLLADYLESGLDALGISPADAEEDLY